MLEEVVGAVMVVVHYFRTKLYYNIIQPQAWAIAEKSPNERMHLFCMYALVEELGYEQIF
jgi:hypothetical protein